MNPPPEAVPIINMLRGIQPKGDYIAAYCPAHDDRSKRSLSVTIGTLPQSGRRVLRMHCFTGCRTEDIARALGLELRDLVLDTPGDRQPGSRPSGGVRGASTRPAPTAVKQTDYEIRDPAGELIAIHHRIDLSDGKKRIWWTRNGESGLGGMSYADLPLYGVHRLQPGFVFVTEGEKAADALWARNVQAVGTVTGSSGLPSGASLAPLVPHEVICWPDNDDPGLKHMHGVAAILTKLGRSPLWFTWEGAPPKGDAADYPADMVIDDAWITRFCEVWYGDADAILLAWRGRPGEVTPEVFDPFERFGR